MNIVLVGYRGCGKTSAGRHAAQRLGWSFVDTDALIQQRAGMTIREIYAHHGERRFRSLEGEIVSEITQHDEQVISTGGGILLLHEENLQALKDCGKIVWLRAPADILWQRVIADPVRQTDRPVIDPAAGFEAFRQGLVQREPLYAHWADVILYTQHWTPEMTAEQILSAIGVKPDRP